MAKKDKPFRPMLAPNKCVDPEKVAMPCLASIKIDGIRCIIRDGIPVTRTIKPVRNRFITAVLSGLPDGLDGELVCGKPYGHDVMKRAQEGVMTADGEPDFTFYVFDRVGPEAYIDRYNKAVEMVREAQDREQRWGNHVRLL